MRLLIHVAAALLLWAATGNADTLRTNPSHRIDEPTNTDTATLNRGADEFAEEEVEHEESSLFILESMKIVEAWQKKRHGRHLQGLNYTIPVYAHVILRSDDQTDGTAEVTADSLRAQLDHVNQIMQDTPFYFQFQSLERKIHSTWANCKKTSQDTEMRKALHQGQEQSLNLYICDASSSRFHGWSSFPWWVDDDYTEYSAAEDGITIGFTSFPNSQSYNAMRLNHEIGHWLGLFHTYQNGCVFPGDGVADTPAQLTGSLACISYRNTCTDEEPGTVDPGPDPIYNIMNSAPSSCRRAFTEGQRERMHALFEHHRVKHVVALAGSETCTPVQNSCSSHSECCEGLACLGSSCLPKLKIDDAIRQSSRERLKESIRKRRHRGNRLR